MTNLKDFYDGITSWVDKGGAIDFVYLDFRITGSQNGRGWKGPLWVT